MWGYWRNPNWSCECACGICWTWLQYLRGCWFGNGWFVHQLKHGNRAIYLVSCDEFEQRNRFFSNINRDYNSDLYTYREFWNLRFKWWYRCNGCTSEWRNYNCFRSLLCRYSACSIIFCRTGRNLVGNRYYQSSQRNFWSCCCYAFNSYNYLFHRRFLSFNGYGRFCCLVCSWWNDYTSRTFLCFGITYYADCSKWGWNMEWNRN